MGDRNTTHGLHVRTFVSGWTVIKQIAIDSTPIRAFNALTRPRHLNAWFTRDAKVSLKVGGRYSNRDRDKGRFLDIVPNERLRFTWDNPRYGTNSIVEILLKRVKGRTVLTLIHSGFKQRKDFEEYASKISGWNWALENLKAHLEHKRVVDFGEWLKKNRGRFSNS